MHWHALENVKGQLVHLYWPILLSSCCGHGSLDIDGDINRIKSYFWPFRICNLMIFYKIKIFLNCNYSTVLNQKVIWTFQKMNTGK